MIMIKILSRIGRFIKHIPSVLYLHYYFYLCKDAKKNREMIRKVHKALEDFEKEHPEEFKRIEKGSNNV